MSLPHCWRGANKEGWDCTQLFRLELRETIEPIALVRNSIRTMKFYEPAVAVLVTLFEGSSGRDATCRMAIDISTSRGGSLTTAEAVHSMSHMSPQDEAGRSRDPGGPVTYHPLLQASREGVAWLDAELTARMRSVDPNWIDWANDDRRADKRPNRREVREMAGSVLPGTTVGNTFGAVAGGIGGVSGGGMISTASANSATSYDAAFVGIMNATSATCEYDGRGGGGDFSHTTTSEPVLNFHVATDGGGWLGVQGKPVHVLYASSVVAILPVRISL